MLVGSLSSNLTFGYQIPYLNFLITLFQLFLSTFISTINLNGILLKSAHNLKIWFHARFCF